MSSGTLLRLHTEVVRPEWIDYNGHMNLAYYVLAFDHATDVFFDRVGLDAAYRERTGCSPFLLETHVSYHDEMKQGDSMSFETQLLGHDHKRLHFFHFMYHTKQKFLAATTELMFMNIDTQRGRSAPIPDDVLASLAAVMESHLEVSPHSDVGRVIGLRRKHG